MMYFLNRLRGTYAYFAKINAIILGVLFGLVIDVPASMYSFWQSVEATLNAIIAWCDWLLSIAIPLVSLPVDTLALFTIPTMISIGYLAGESMGWGEWIGGIVRRGRAYVITKRNGDTNGIQWLATRFSTLDSQNYFRLALFIRGIYWWLPALLPLAFVIHPLIILLAIVVVAIGFPASVLAANHFKPEFGATERWSLAEKYYGGIQDVILIGLIGVYYVTN